MSRIGSVRDRVVISAVDELSRILQGSFSSGVTAYELALRRASSPCRGTRLKRHDRFVVRLSAILRSVEPKQVRAGAVCLRLAHKLRGSTHDGLAGGASSLCSRCTVTGTHCGSNQVEQAVQLVVKKRFAIVLQMLLKRRTLFPHLLFSGISLPAHLLYFRGNPCRPGMGHQPADYQEETHYAEGDRPAPSLKQTCKYTCPAGESEQRIGKRLFGMGHPSRPLKARRCRTRAQPNPLPRFIAHQ